jgi:hypothetical protein
MEQVLTERQGHAKVRSGGFCSHVEKRVRWRSLPAFRANMTAAEARLAHPLRLRPEASGATITGDRTYSDVQLYKDIAGAAARGGGLRPRRDPLPPPPWAPYKPLRHRSPAHTRLDRGRTGLRLAHAPERTGATLLILAVPMLLAGLAFLPGLARELTRALRRPA